MHINILLCACVCARAHTHTHTRPRAINSRMCNSVGQYNTNPQKEESLAHLTENLSCPMP